MTSGVYEGILCLTFEEGCDILGVTSTVDSTTGMTSSVEKCRLCLTFIGCVILVMASVFVTSSVA